MYTCHPFREYTIIPQPWLTFLPVGITDDLCIVYDHQLINTLNIWSKKKILNVDFAPTYCSRSIKLRLIWLYFPEITRNFLCLNQLDYFVELSVVIMLFIPSQSFKCLCIYQILYIIIFCYPWNRNILISVEIFLHKFVYL